MNRSHVRSAFKSAGYRVYFETNPFNDGLVSLSFTDETPMRRHSFSSAAPVEFYEKHKKAFDVYRSVAGKWLDDTEQKIV